MIKLGSNAMSCTLIFCIQNIKMLSLWNGRVESNYIDCNKDRVVGHM